MSKLAISQELVDVLEAKGFTRSHVVTGGNSEAYYYHLKGKFQIKLDRYRNLIKILDKAGFFVAQFPFISNKEIEKFTELN